MFVRIGTGSVQPTGGEVDAAGWTWKQYAASGEGNALAAGEDPEEQQMSASSVQMVLLAWGYIDTIREYTY